MDLTAAFFDVCGLHPRMRPRVFDWGSLVTLIKWESSDILTRYGTVEVRWREGPLARFGTVTCFSGPNPFIHFQI